MNGKYRIAILGATSQIAKDLIISFSIEQDIYLHLFARRPEVVTEWLNCIGLSECYQVDNFSLFGTQDFDAIINFVGVGNPEKLVEMGTSIFDVTLQYDDLALKYVDQRPTCRYIFLSSGAVYGSSFDAPVDASTNATISINNLQPKDWYATAKLHAECRHRSLIHLPIVDIRVFNYFSHTQDMDARFLITDIVSAICKKRILKASADLIVRDYIGADDFHQLVTAILTSPAANVAVDCFSKSPIGKLALLAAMQEKFGLSYELVQIANGVNASGDKPFYYSHNRRAEDFCYKPRMTSLDLIMQETTVILKSAS